MIQKTLVPSYREPDLGNLRDEDRVEVMEEGEWNAIVEPIEPRESIGGMTIGELHGAEFRAHENGFGLYWTIYPRKAVAFREVTVVEPASASAEGGEGTPEVLVTNYCAIGSVPGASGGKPIDTEASDIYCLYFRPVVTIIPAADDFSEHDAPETSEGRRTHNDRIVDEALLHGESVYGWHSVTNICVADPRHNAYARYWRGFPDAAYALGPLDWDSAVATTNLSTEVHEYPFMHFNRPLESPGEIGHIYTSPDRLGLTRHGDNIGAWQGDRSRPLHDTIAFSSRSGAALLDLFTVNSLPAKEADLAPAEGAEAAVPAPAASRRHSRPTRGLVQANTEHLWVIAALFSQAKLGWRAYPTDLSDPSDSSDLPDLSDHSDPVEWAQAYSNALVAVEPVGLGWRSFADMLPSIATNTLLPAITPPSGYGELAHDWVEDALRHLPEQVSFRQNIFLIVVAAQTLSPASTLARPVVLADQRAAITIIRDAFTGRWVIHSWRWL